ncbi:hypothetical protein BKI52_15360 [marine bacterium AO1-C]|nr:hypothetical protein BKI52_15360 [marine bacterium AO1-C]
MPTHHTNEVQQDTQNNGITQRKEQAGDKATKQGQKPAIQAKQIPIQAKQKPVQAKQAPIQRNESKGVVQRNGGDDLKERMSSQYKVDLSGYKEHPNSSFPASVGAEATIQGNNIHYGPGKFTEQNRKHELGHAIDNTLNGTPKGDKVINGKNIDTTREAAADKIMNAPLQAKADPVQMKTASGSFSSGTDQPLQLKYEMGKAVDTLYVHKSNYKDVQGGGMYIISKRPTQVTVKDGIKDTLEAGTIVEYDKNYTDESGLYIRVKYRKDDSIKIGFVEAGSIERYFTKKEKRQLLKEKKQEEKQRKKRLQKEKKIRTQKEIQQEKDELIPHFRDESNLGVEVEMRNIILTRNDNKDWDDDGEPVELTSGGKDGSWVTDQQAGNQAVIEWNTDHPKFKDSNQGVSFQEKLNKLNQVLESNGTGTLDQLVKLAKPIMDIGDINQKYKAVTFENFANYVTQTQVNMEVPFTNIGKIPTNKEQEKHDSANMFSGSKSKKPKEVFIKSRELANALSKQMLELWNKKNPLDTYKISQMWNLNSTLTVFLHTAIFNGLGGGKDPQGVLFKTGAGDLVRTGLDSKQKKVLWHAMNENSGVDFYEELAYKGSDIYKLVYQKGSSSTQEEDIYTSIKREAILAFKAVSQQELNDLYLAYKNERGGKKGKKRRKILEELERGFLSNTRWGDEKQQGGYGDQIDSDYVEFDKYKIDTVAPKDRKGLSNPFSMVKDGESNLEASGVSTGKDFGLTHHSYNGKHIKGVEIAYILAEIRRNDNDLNKLVGKHRPKVKPEKLKEIQEKIKDIQTPF